MIGLHNIYSNWRFESEKKKWLDGQCSGVLYTDSLIPRFFYMLLMAAGYRAVKRPLFKIWRVSLLPPSL